MIGIGFSLGANVMVRYLGQEGEWCRLKGGGAFACVNTLSIHFSLMSLNVMFSAMGSECQ
jgi:predicted alpha/beta-fold hydrolase